MRDYHETTVDKYMFKVAKDRWYNSEGIWEKEEGVIVRIGLSDFLQQRGHQHAARNGEEMNTTTTI